MYICQYKNTHTMKTIQLQLFKFEELSQEAKDYAVSNFNKEGEVFLDMFNEDCLETAEIHGFENIKLQYSLSYSQGDGLSFSCETFTKLEEILKEVLGKGKEKTASIIAEYCTIEIKGNRGHYCYASSSDIDLYLNDNCYDMPNIENIISQALSKLEVIYTDLCTQLEKQGYSEIEYQLSEEYIIDEILSNGYDFLESGEIFS